jgi:hypothetical protein
MASRKASLKAIERIMSVYYNEQQKYKIIGYKTKKAAIRNWPWGIGSWLLVLRLLKKVPCIFYRGLSDVFFTNG